MNKRRKLIFALGVSALTTPARLFAQRSASVARVGVLSTGSLQDWELASFREELKALGWNEGGNLALEIRSAGGDLDKLQSLAAELATTSQLIVSATGPATRAAINATKSVPIVMVGVGDPVGLGLVKSFTHPGGNVTGVSNIARDLAARRLALLKETVPKAKRVAVLFHPDDPVTPLQRRDIEPAARTLGLQLAYWPIRTAEDLEQAFAQMHADAVYRMAGQANTFSRRTVELTIAKRLPAMLLTAQDVAAGGLMSYWTDHIEHYRRAAAYVDRILKGAKPADLPVEQPTRFEMVINMKTAKALGIKIPNSILVQATRVID
jgi:putative ABC transport system substrate-binding protein